MSQPLVVAQTKWMKICSFSSFSLSSETVFLHTSKRGFSSNRLSHRNVTQRNPPYRHEAFRGLFFIYRVRIHIFEQRFAYHLNPSACCRNEDFNRIKPNWISTLQFVNDDEVTRHCWRTFHSISSFLSNVSVCFPPPLSPLPRASTSSPSLIPASVLGLLGRYVWKCARVWVGCVVCANHGKPFD